ncbi:MAG: TolC family protein, partial [Alphaproteobacteria bacterium]|nr:TolC family protein [Alphaproteobacteria bacterium]
MKKTLFLFPVVLLPALAGCALNETSYVRPQTQVPATWSVEAQGEKARLSDLWMVFGDEELNLLVDEVLKVNDDLAAAALTAKAARLRADLAFDQFLPDLSATATASNSRGLRKGASITRAYTAKVNASYEVDLWGKLSAEADSADWEAKATEEDRE